MSNGHASTAAFNSPPPSQASIDGKDNEPDSAAFEEWKGTVQLTTINGVTSFEGQFEGELSLNLLQALVQTWSTTQKTIHTPACGRAGGVKRKTGSRGKFTPEEDDLLIDLKTNLSLPWSDIHRRFSNRFPGRSKGALQVRYCTKLKNSK
ncbi:uncharacterized protein F5Z01DRAFT_472150 [Emericellopsis atlantica]|uniref:Myb-like domain-containing protein n=1 Tax=Emericellopsis atlantica TaxID=2614577 RepID=A0A9P8CK29_9HYPO|nr:uncharacterized protein F5Z01DRAFT_472150 [Emericellopsis atlantica]KAG9249627.1 hypothetical protein F5Z01DRAFT_472150 [Emericellopsis atlantica]